MRLLGRSASILAGIALAMADPNPVFKDKPIRIRTKEEDEEIQRKYRNITMKRGVNEWQIDGYTVYARNYKNACRKVDNLKRSKNS